MYTQLQLRDSDRPPVTLTTLDQMKQRGEKIACLTAYDASFAVLLDAAGVDVVLVGDSLGMVIQGHDTTVPVTMDQMVYHCAAVARGLHRPFLMADLPFMSYPSRELALSNAVRLMQEGGARVIKLESGKGQTDIVEFLARHDIAVCAHLGLKPQSVHKTGGFRVQGAKPKPRSACSRMRSRWKRPAPICCCSSAFRPSWRHDFAGRQGARDRHRRRSRYRRADPGALRCARYHLGPQAALRA